MGNTKTDRPIHTAKPLTEEGKVEILNFMRQLSTNFTN